MTFEPGARGFAGDKVLSVTGGPGFRVEFSGGPSLAVFEGWVPGSGITPGTGSVVIGGSEQSVQIFTCSIPVKPPAGTQQQVQPNSGGGGCYKTVYDTGWVSITVNGFTKTVNYGQYSSDTTIANAFTTAFNGDSNSPVTASNTGATVYLTSKALGTAANYTVSSSANTNDPTDFGGSSFYGTPSGSTLTGGTNGPPTYDSGTVTVTVNGFQAPVSYGQGSTPYSIASSLATALSVSSSPVTATANGAVVTLTSKATGSSSNYSLSASVTGSFNPVSFAASPSGSALTGGGSTGVAYSVSFPTSNGYAPNGDVLNVVDSVNGTWSYAYDDLNRLCAANQSSTAPVCGQPTQSLYTYDYDQYGNRWHQNGPQSMQLSFSGNSTTNNNRMDGYSYDAAGNLLVDNANNHYTYDAEGRIVKVVGAAGTSCYVYDAEGQRVRKDTGSTNGCADTSTGTSVDYLYDLAGHEITEVSSAGAWNRGEVYAGGKHVATYSGGTTGTTYFIHADWLGTERARTTAQGASYETCTSLPFGDGMICSGGDPSPMHFTGKQRDSESNLDDFGARYFSSSMGRWASPDWAASAEAVPYAKFGDPQSLNLYAYVHNNPATDADADGHCDVCQTILTRVIQYVATHAAATGTGINATRQEYVSRAAQTTSVAERDALKVEMRGQGPALGRALSQQAASDPARIADRVAKTGSQLEESVGRTNLGATRAAEAAGTIGKVAGGLAVGIAVYDVATAPQGQKLSSAATEAGGLGGAAVGGEYGAAGGAALGGPAGAVVGGIVGSIAGGFGGSAAVKAVINYQPKPVEHALPPGALWF